MSFEALLRSAILGYSPVADLVADGDDFRFQQTPLDANIGYPAIGFGRVDTVYGQTHSGRTDCYPIRIQYDCWDRTPQGADELADALVDSFETFNLSQVAESPQVLSGRPYKLLNRLVRPEPEAEPPIFRVIVEARHYVREQ